MWFLLDEAADLKHLPQLPKAMTQNRKSNNPMVLGFQGKDQIETFYGKLGKTMLSQPNTRIYLKTGEPDARSGSRRRSARCTSNGCAKPLQPGRTVNALSVKQSSRRDRSRWFRTPELPAYPGFKGFLSTTTWLLS